MANKDFDPKHELWEAEQELSVLVIGESSFGKDLAQIGLVEDAYLTKVSKAYDDSLITFRKYVNAVRKTSDEHTPENPFTQKRDEAYYSYKN